MFKIIGITGLVISCGLIGVNQKQKLNMRIRLLEDYYQMVISLKGNISYFKEPITDVFNRASKNSRFKAHSLLKAIECDSNNKHIEIPQIWSKNVLLIYNNCPVTKKDIEVMSYLGNFIGQTDYSNQLQHFEYLESNIKLQIQNAKDELHSKGPMYNKIGYFVGAIIGIILI